MDLFENKELKEWFDQLNEKQKETFLEILEELIENEE